MENNKSKKTFNSNTITLKIDSYKSVDRNFKHNDKILTELKHDALQLLLISVNPLRSEYNLEDKMNKVNKLTGKMRDLLKEAKSLLIDAHPSNKY
jgi:hypothetical protein